MTETTTSPTTPEKTQAKAAANGSAQTFLTSDQKQFAYKIKENIDEHGKYAEFLKPYAQGYALAKGIDEYEAKQEINAQFTQEIGIDLKGAVENWREKRGLSVENGRGGR